jgi:excisionase family DNA binding protein
VIAVGSRCEYYSVVEAADYMNTTVRFVRRLIAERRVTFYKVGRLVRLKRSDLEAFVLAGKVDPVNAASVRGDLRRVS